ncbi:MAG: polysaccharide biosynthesis/export family protein [Flavobacteriaceae bacterium]|nr:polysaccharide biosynthesis/export family protein [Flavobacteriaceae bacterium]
MKKIVLLLSISFLIFSCASKKDILYFQDSEALNQATMSQSFDPIIESNDILHITVSSINEVVLKPFLKNEQSQQNNNQNPGLDGYFVNVNGTIGFPVLGEIKVAGFTRNQVENILKEKISVYVKDVVVDVRIMNFEITIMGEVAAPGVYLIKDERVSLPEALALAGDLTTDGKRSSVTIIRQENGIRKVSVIDITKSDFFNTEFFYLKQNDLVYVEPSTKGVKKSGFIPDIPALLSLFTVILSTVILLTK